MREIGRGAGVTVAAAVAILERQQEEQRRTAPPVRLRLRGDLSQTTEAGISRDSSDSSVSSVGDTIARLQGRFSAGSVAGDVLSSSVDAELKQNTDAKSAKHFTRPKRSEFAPARRKVPDSFDVKANRVVTEKGVTEIRKSPSTKNISALLRNSAAVTTPSTATLSSSDSKTQDLRKCVGNGTPSSVNDCSRSDATHRVINDSNSSSTEQTFRSDLSTSNTRRDPGNLQRLLSAKDVLDHHDRHHDYSLGGASARTETLRHPQIIVEGSKSDGNVPRKRPRVIHLRDTDSQDKGPKSNPEVAPVPHRQQAQSTGEIEALPSNNSSVKIVLEYPPPPPSPPPENDTCGPLLTGGTSASNSRRILATTESLGSYMHG
jgi:hypothetical protein